MKIAPTPLSTTSWRRPKLRQLRQSQLATVQRQCLVISRRVLGSDKELSGVWVSMSDDGGSVTLVFYRIGTGFDLFSEPFLNIVAAAFQMSSFTHVEVAIGTPSAQRPTQHTKRISFPVSGI